MKVNKRKMNKQKVLKSITCPNCNFNIDIDDIGLVMFTTCTVFSCPICKKTIAIQPKGKEFSIETVED